MDKIEKQDDAGVVVEGVRYDAGLLSDYGGGNVEWWQDYIRAELDRSHDFYTEALAAAPQPPSGGESSFDRRFADMLVGILGEVQDELGFTDEDKLCANGSAEIIAAIRDLKERAITAPPSAPMGVAYLDIGVGGYMDLGSELSDEELAKLPYGRHVLGIIGTHGVDGYVLAQQPAAQPAAPAPCAFRSLLAEARRQYRDSDAAGDVLAWLDERVLDVDHAASVAVPEGKEAKE